MKTMQDPIAESRLKWAQDAENQASRHPKGSDERAAWLARAAHWLKCAIAHEEWAKTH